MTCRCTFHSPFRFAEFGRPSIFATDSAFAKGASTGQTMASIQTQAMHRFEMENGRSAGSIFGISEHADRLAEEGRQRRKRAASHYRRNA